MSRQSCSPRWGSSRSASFALSVETRFDGSRPRISDSRRGPQSCRQVQRHLGELDRAVLIRALERGERQFLLTKRVVDLGHEAFLLLACALIYVARTRNRFTAASRAQLFRRFKGLEINECPFVNPPEARSGRWGQGLTTAKMAECQWLKPVLVGQVRVPGMDR
jgi:hypothetical protein